MPPNDIKKQILDLLDQLSTNYFAQSLLASRQYAKREAVVKAELCASLRRMIDRLIG